METKEDGRIKLYVTYRSLHLRRAHPGLMTRGEYVPLSARGPNADNIFAFVRRSENHLVLAIAPRFMTRLVPEAGGLPLGPEVWKDAVLMLPDIRPHRRFQNVFTGEIHRPIEREGQAALGLAEVFGNFPVGLLTALS